MAAPTYATDAVVLRKTKLGESDLIITLLARDGSQLRAVAKGARKPKSQFASRLELYSCVRLLMIKGRSLDIVKEVELIQSFAPLRMNLELSLCASPMVELLDKTTQVDLEHPHLFDMTVRALEILSTTDSSKAPLIAGAHLLKSFAFVGFRPLLSECVVCGEAIDLSSSGGFLRVSFLEGGAVCECCAGGIQAQLRSINEAAWVNLLLESTFSQIEKLPAGFKEGMCVLRFCQEWARIHAGCNLKSLTFLFTSDIFDTA